MKKAAQDHFVAESLQADLIHHYVQQNARTPVLRPDNFRTFLQKRAAVHKLSGTVNMGGPRQPRHNHMPKPGQKDKGLEANQRGCKQLGPPRLGGSSHTPGYNGVTNHCKITLHMFVISPIVTAAFARTTPLKARSASWSRTIGAAI